MGESRVTIAQPINDKARMAFSSLVHALFELESYAVARIVEKDGKVPQIILLAPSIELDLEALIDVPLPFAEDLRVYRFPPLDRVITASGSTLKQHRYLPDDNLVDAMSDYVDGMDLSTAGTDEDGQAAEYMTVEETFTPIIHRINQAIRQRAIFANDPIVPPSEMYVVMFMATEFACRRESCVLTLCSLTKWSQPPEDLALQSAHKLEKLVAAAGVQKGESTPDQSSFLQLINPQYHPKSKAHVDAERSLNLCPASMLKHFSIERSVRRSLLTIPFQSSSKCSQVPRTIVSFLMLQNKLQTSFACTSPIVRGTPNTTKSKQI
jgi:Ku70/Ku80 beta-barrel domain